MFSHKHHHQHEIPEEVPKEILIGVKRELPNTFDDAKELGEHQGPFKVREITIQFNKEHIIGIQFHYETLKGFHVNGHDLTKDKPLAQMFGQVHKETFHVEEGDELFEIFGCYGLRMNEVGFKTYKGKTKTYGHSDGEKFSYKFPGFTFGRAAGGYDKNIDYLILRTHPIISELKEQLLSYI